MGEDQTARFFFVPPGDLSQNPVRFPPEESHHLRDVVRLGRGVLITAVDGGGNGAVLRLRKRGDEIVGEVERRFRSAVEPGRPVAVAFAMLKGQASDALVEGCTELGAAVFQPFFSTRSVPRPVRGRGESRRLRMERIARSAMKVARAASCPAVRDPLGWKELLLTFGEYEQVLLCRRDESAGPPPVAKGPVLVVIGPEGGLTGEEEKEALAAGARAFSLGPRNLRSSTAALAACSALLATSSAWDGGREGT